MKSEADMICETTNTLETTISVLFNSLNLADTCMLTKMENLMPLTMQSTLEDAVSRINQPSDLMGLISV